MSVAPAVKRELETDGASGEGMSGGPGGGGLSPGGSSGGGGAGAGRKRRKQAVPSRAPPPAHPQPPPPPPLHDLHAKMADIYKSALAFGELALPPFDPLAAFRLLPRHEPPRIFNPEAYCDLCCKEFCNKYFLKTHRANKHGIYDGPEPPPPAPLALPAPPAPPRRASDEESAGAPRRLSPDSARRARDAGFQPDALRRLGVINPEAFCEICCKEYCNKYFLRTHRERRHGAPLSGTPTRSPAPHEPTLHSPPLDTPPRRDDLDELAVKRECDSPQEPRDGQTSPLNLIVEERGSPGSASEELRKLQTMISQLNELAAERLADGERPPEMTPRDDRAPSISPPPGEERRGAGASSAGGSSFCEICNKELCNKYFMRTHMQRMHGISLESGAQLGGVTCDICHKELCSKYFLRVHKHNTHGVPAPPAPPPPAPHEPCPLCARRFRGPRALRAHLLAEHAPPRAAPAPVPAPHHLLRECKPYACSYCPFTTDVLAFLFAHERAHTTPHTPVPPPREDCEEPRSPERSERNERNEHHDRDEAPTPDEGVFACSRCEFSAREFGSLEAHVRAAHGAGGGGALLAVPRAPAAPPLTLQPFVVEEESDSAAVPLSLLPALVFLPVRRRATRRATVTLSLTPA